MEHSGIANTATGLESGLAVLISAGEGIYRLGVIARTDADEQVAVHPFTEHLVRERTDDVATSSMVSIKSVLAESPVCEMPKRKPFEPYVAWRTGTILAQLDESKQHLWRLFVITEDVVRDPQAKDEDKLLPVRPYVCRFGPAGKDFKIDATRVMTLRSLRSRAEIHFRCPPDEFLDIIEIPLIEAWSTAEETVAEFPQDRIPGYAEVRYAAPEASLDIIHDRAKWPTDKLPYSWNAVAARLRDGLIGSSRTSTPTWEASLPYLVGPRTVDGIERMQAKPSRLHVEFGSGELIATRETLRGIQFDAFSDLVLPRYPDPFHLITAGNAFRVRMFDRDARIYAVTEHDTAVVYEGEPLDNERRTSLVNLLSYLAGNRAEHDVTETFGTEGRLTWTFKERGGFTKRGLEPILIGLWNSESTRLVGEEFSNLLGAMHALYMANSPKLSAALHHYFEGVNSSYPVSRILMLAVAIDTLVALRVGTDDVPIVPAQTFTKLAKPLREVIRFAQKVGALDENQATLLAGNIGKLNRPSARQRQKNFWVSVGIVPTSEEQKILDTRHEVVHEGHVGDERTRKALKENQYRSDVLANLFNRAFLKMLGWPGLYRDATTLERRELPLDMAAPIPDDTTQDRLDEPAK